MTVFSDNLNHNLHLSDYKDFQTEYPHIPVVLHKTGGIMHDRFIILDYDTMDEMMFHCGASAKDAAVKLNSRYNLGSNAYDKAQRYQRRVDIDVTPRDRIEVA